MSGAPIGAGACRVETGGMPRISWPKKSSGVTGDPDEDTLGKPALPPGLVDAKARAVSEVRSGLKFSGRKAAKNSPAPSSSNRKPGKSA